jgi:MIP family channel proteins
MNSNLTQRLYSEFLGTFALVFIGSGAIMTASSNNGTLLDIALAHGLVLGVAVTAFMRIAGHFNPAVTIGFMFTRRITPAMAGLHIVAQVIGAIVAAFALKALFPADIFAGTHGGGQSIANNVSALHAWVFEAIGTFFLMTAVYGTAVDKRSPNIGGFGVGLTLAFVILVLGPLTGGAVNPARAFGPAVAHGTFEAQFIYWTAPIVGAILAALAYEHLILKRDPEPAG